MKAAKGEMTPNHISILVIMILSLAGKAFGQEPGIFPKTADELGLSLSPSAPDKARVTWANWQFGPYNRWSYQHVREILPTANIMRSASPSVLPTAKGHGHTGIIVEIDGERPLPLMDALRLTYTDGFLVIKDGKVIMETYLNGMQPDTPHLAWSVSKSITGDTAAILWGEGLLDLDKTVGDYVPELAESGWGPDKIRTILDMQTGSAWIEDYDDPDSTVRRQDVSDMLLPPTEELASLPEGNRLFLPTVGRNDDNHGRFIYKSGDTDVLGWVLEKAGGMPLAELISKKLWQPLGAEFDGYVTVDRTGFALASGGINMTLRDLARLGLANLRGGKLNGRQVIPTAWINDRIANADHDAWQRGDGNDDDPNGYYSRFWWHTGDEHGAYYAHGVHGQWIYIVPEANMVIVKLSSHPTPSARAESAIERAIFKTIINTVATTKN